jgi:integrase
MYRTPNGILYVRYYSPKLKRQIELSLKTDKFEKAKKIRKKILENIGEQKTNETVGYKRFRDVVAAFRTEVVWDTPITKRTAMNQIDKHILPWFGGYDPDRIDNLLWRRYAQERRESDPSCSLLNARKYLWKICNWAHQKRIIKNKFVPDDFEVHRKSPGRIVTREQLNEIQSHLNQDWVDLSELAFQMAFRIGELKNLEWDRVNFKTGEISLEAKHTKNRMARKPVMTESARSILERRYKFKTSDFVFPNGEGDGPFSKSDLEWQKAKSAAAITCRFHDLRHTWLTSAFKNSNRYAEICQYAGLALGEAIKTYVKFSSEDMAIVADTMSSFLNSSGEFRGEASTK